MDKSFSFTLDIRRPLDRGNFFELWRGDNVAFDFKFQKDGSDLDLTGVSKLRVFAKRRRPGKDVDKDDTPLFAADFEGDFKHASFPSSSTAGDAGEYLMTVMLLDDAADVITAQGIRFNLLENGYAGIYQPSEDFRDEVIDAKDKAEAAAKNAGDSATSASQSKEAAASSASAAATSAGQAAESAQASENSAAQAAQSAQDAQTSKTAAQAAQAAAEAAAGTAVNATDLAALCRRAANVGYFDFNSGYLDIPGGAAAINSLPISICLTYDVKEWNLDTRLNLFLSDNNTAGFSLWIADKSNPFMDFMAKNRSGSSRQRLRTTPPPTGRHTLVVTVGDTPEGGILPLKYFIDGIAQDVSNSGVVKTITDTDMSGSSGGAFINTSQSNTAGAQSAASAQWSISRMKIFNFDMSASGALYTVADYAAGIDESPALKQGIVATTDRNMGASTGEGWTHGAVSNTTGTSGDWKFGARTTYIKNRELSQSDYDAGLPAEITSAIDLRTEYAIGVSLATSMLYNDAADFSKYTGISQKCRCSFWLRNNATETSTSVDGLAVGMGYNKAIQLKLSERGKYPFNQWVRVEETVDFAFPTGLADSQMRMAISSHATPNGSDAYPVSIADFKFEILGAELSLADSADGPQIRDESGNSNHALISGSVLPSKQNNPAHCTQKISWAGTSTLQNVCGDSAIPVNSKVTAYAKASGAVTASFKAAVNAAESKALTANTLTEIGSWLCSAAGAFSVQPSAAYTGSIEVFLKIERL